MKVSRFFTWLVALVLATGAAVSFAQAEPTVDQIYQAANAGQVRKAQDMIDQVLRSHPNSGKAHYVKAELAARELDAATARQELARAEQLAPGLPFARPEAVQALRTQVERISRAPSTTSPSRDARGDTRQLGNSAAAPPQQAPQRSFPWGLLAVGAVIVLGVLAFLRRRGAQSAAGYGGPGAPTGPQGAPGAPYGGPAGPYPGGYPPGAQPYGAPQPGMGSSIGRGLAAGVALGAGAAVAHEMGRRMFDHGPQGSPLGGPSADGGFVDPSGLDGMANADMGGQNFGISDPGTWDDAGGSFDAGGGDWDT